MSKEKRTLEVYQADIQDGLDAIAHVDQNLIPRLVDADGHPAQVKDMERWILIGITMLARFSPRYNQETGRVDIMYESLAYMVRVIRTYEATGDWKVLGGLVRAIKDDVFDEIVKMAIAFG